MLTLLVVHLAMALAAPALVGWLGRRAFLIMAAAPASAFIWAVAHTRQVIDGNYPTQSWKWIPELGIELSFRLDTLSWLMLLIAGGIGAAVLTYCSTYFGVHAQGLGRFGATLTGFAGAMVGLVTTDDLLLLFVFWEITTVLSYLLIGHYAERKASRRAAMQAIIVTTAGGLAMLVGVIILGQSAGTYKISAILAAPPASSAVTAAVVCLIIGAATKSALIPAHFWLPAAMAAPTPVSAYLHAAAMVKAGVYLIARFAPGFSHLETWRWLILVLGGATMLLGGYRATRQYDLKLVLAYGTVSQLGLLVMLVGFGTKAAALAGLAMLAAHAMFKAALFLVVGIVDAATGTRDLRRLSGVGRAIPITAIAGALATASMIGLPPFAGYVAKEAAFDAFFHDDSSGVQATIALAVIVLGSVLTVAYGLRFWWGAFASKPLDKIDGDEPAPVVRQPFSLVAPAFTLAVIGLVAALIPHHGETLLVGHADLYPAGEPGHLVLWGGFTPVLWTTVGVLALGIGLFLARDTVARFQKRMPHVIEAERIYRGGMRRLDALAADVTAQTQRGSLPFYLGVIFLALVAGPGLVMLTQAVLPDDVLWYESHGQLGASLIICIAAIFVARSRRRLRAVLLAGVVGYGVAYLFMEQGAPDLALTQVLVETITLVVFVLVLRQLPPYFSNRPLAASRYVRMAIGGIVGLVVMGIAITVPGARVHEPVSVDFPEAAVQGGGKNIVNVTLVDIRAWDTMGEIAVLLVCATGVASLIFLRRRSGDVLRVAQADPISVWSRRTDPAAALRLRGIDSNTERVTQAREWLRAGRTLAPHRRSVIFEVVVRLVFHSMIVFALFLLFSGHNSPGGGFAGGLVAGLALVTRYLAGGRYELGEALPIHPGLILGFGLFLAVGSGIIPVFFGHPPLSSAIIDLELPVFGDIHIVTTLLFDVGVFLVVVGLMLDVLRSLGAEVDRQIDAGDVEDPEEASTGSMETREHAELVELARAKVSEITERADTSETVRRR